MISFTRGEKELLSQDFKAVQFSNSRLEDTTFSTCVFHKCQFKETQFLKVKFQDCTFRNCDLSLVDWRGCDFQNTHFENSQLIGINWMETNLNQQKYLLGKTVDFTRCVLNHSTFMGMNLKNICLTHCTAHDVSFEDADLTNADCRGSDFAESRFANTNLTNTDFTGARNYAISATVNLLKKTKFSMPEAMSLLNSLDIVLTEDDLP